MMSFEERDKVELPALEQLRSLGWTCMEGAELMDDKERNSRRDAVLEKRLIASIQRINPWLSAQNLSKVVRKLTRTQYTDLVEANQKIWKMLTECVSVKQDRGHGNKSQTVHIIDFENLENNDFLCVSQFRITGTKEEIIPDIVLFVNGLPLAVIECKSPYGTDPMEEGITQLLRYANRRDPSSGEGAEKLFHYNLMMVSTHRDQARVGTITSRMEHYLEWKDPYPLTAEEMGRDASSQEMLIAGLFSRANFLDILQNFAVFGPVDGRTGKKMARYQQFRTVHKTIERLKTGEDRKGRSGVVWHTQGSGKSLTMVFLILKMRRDPELRDYKPVLLTDRTQLDDQLTSVLRSEQGETVLHAETVEHLMELLSDDTSSIVTSTIQKFQDSAAEAGNITVNESEKIIVLTDEAHRTQYGNFGASLDTALPNAPRIAFTGTPLIREHKTAKTFGSYIDTYTIEQAVRDGATVQILYEGREPEIKLTGDSLDCLFDECFADCTEDQKAEIKRRFGGSEGAILEAPKRIRTVCTDILQHYEKYIRPNGFKAMIVASSRRAAILYKEQLDELGAPKSAVIISGLHNDEPLYHDYTDPKQHKRQIEEFKKPLGAGDGESDQRFLIVRDMLLTGFDAPIAQVMYLDRKLTDHTLLQAIARVNRTHKNKFRGYIVDYYGLSDYLTEALEMFSTEDVSGALTELKEEISKLKNAHTRVLKHFDGMDLDDDEACALSLKDEVKRQQFRIDFQIFSKRMDIILPDRTARPFLQDLKRLGKISKRARNLYRDNQLTIEGAGEKVRKLIEEHIDSTGVDLKIPPIDLLGTNYMEMLDRHKSSRYRASEVEHAIRHYIKVHVEKDPEYYRKLSERLDEIIRRHEEKWDELVQQLLDFRETVASGHQKEAKDRGLTERQFAFYNILKKGCARQQGDADLDAETEEKIKGVAKSVVDMLAEASKRVDCFDKWDELKRLSRNIKHILMEHFDDEALVKSMTDELMHLAKTRFKGSDGGV